jgi:5-formyltetrahydrofolate cyclo-ligase
MNTDKNRLQRQKSELRSKIRMALKNLPQGKIASASAQICTRLEEQPFFQTAATILFFAPLRGETDTWPLLEGMLSTGKTAALPRFDPAEQSYVACRVQNLRTEIVAGQFGVREPSPSCVEISFGRLDLILVPGVAFDLRGNRLGRGKGFYDRLLAEIRGIKCGVAFDEQLVDEVPAENLDVPVDFILTPTRCVKIAG